MATPGGFAHVYLATSEQAIGGTRKHVLKRMLAPDTRTVAQIGKEVEVMKLLKDHPRIVNFIEASCTELSNERGYEIYILMEWCAGGGIIDMMNTRLQNRLTESEILKIFSDTVEVTHTHTCAARELTRLDTGRGAHALSVTSAHPPRPQGRKHSPDAAEHVQAL